MLLFSLTLFCSLFLTVSSIPSLGFDLPSVQEILAYKNSSFCRSCGDVYVVHPYKFNYVKMVGKIGGTAIRRNYLEPTLCLLLFSSSHRTKATKSFGGNVIPEGCLKYLENDSVITDGVRKVKSKLKDYFTFTFIRNPYDRALSSYYYVLPPKTRKSVSFGAWLQNPFSLHTSPTHWASQLCCLAKSPFYPLLQYVGRVESLVDDLNKIIQIINQGSKNQSSNSKKQPNGIQPLQPYSFDPRRSNVNYHPQICDFHPSTISLIQKYYPADTALLGYKEPSCKDSSKKLLDPFQTHTTKVPLILSRAVPSKRTTSVPKNQKKPANPNDSQPSQKKKKKKKEKKKK